MSSLRQCLVWLPHSYTGHGPAESCVRSIEHFAALGLDPTLFVTRARKAIPHTIRVSTATGGVLNTVPYRLIGDFAKRRLANLFKRAVQNAESGTIAYFWPDAPIELVKHAKAHGLICVREMINSPVATAKPLLEAAFKASGIEPSQFISQEMADQETEQLHLCDLVFSSNAEVDAALMTLGIAQDRILNTSFGWVKDRFDNLSPGDLGERDGKFKAVFVGSIGVRKGVPTLFEAWDKAGIDGELLLAGSIEPSLASTVEKYSARPDITLLGHVNDVASLYRSCDAFIFPTVEEGGPQVTYEAAACGAPVITTRMGAARLVEDGVSGLICEAGNSDDLAAAIRKLADDPHLGRSLAAQASQRVDRFEYANVGTQRAQLLLDAVKGQPVGSSAALA